MMEAALNDPDRGRTNPRFPCDVAPLTQTYWGARYLAYRKRRYTLFCNNMFLGPVTAYPEYFAPDFNIKSLMPKYGKKKFSKTELAEDKSSTGRRCNTSCGGNKLPGPFDYNPGVECGPTSISLGYNPQHLRLLDRHCCSHPEVHATHAGKK